MGTLEGKVAIVTGASRGIGKGLALGLAAEGAAIVVTARTENTGDSRLPGSLTETLDAITAAGGRAISIRCDITDEQQVAALVQQTLDTFGRIDVLVNNAGTLFNSSVMDTPMRRWDLIIRVNVRGTIAMTEAVLPVMVRQGGGSVICISSGVVRSRPPGTAAYGMTKAAVDFFCESLAGEVRSHNIAVNSLYPGAIKTEGAVFVTPDRDWTGWMEPKDVAPSVIYLAQQRGDGLTGRVVDRNSFGVSWGPGISS
ncbi:MAG: SDR family NAD(P)-dependent oxidoreductase [Chloroflexi bacterium]|nr:SDR family NAD(P)-dependent oxidoreductase [Chloroflexota bacterium]